MPSPLAPPEPQRVVVDRLVDGRNVLVTGAGRNVGRSIALEMKAHGANVFCTDVDSARAERFHEELASMPGRSKVVRSDVSRPHDNEAVVSSLRADGVSLDVLVNNVGIVSDDFGASFDTNVTGPMHLTRLVTRQMIDEKRAGNVIFLTSIHQDSVFTRNRAYSATKAALAMIVKDLAVELAPHHIRVNAIAPGDIRTDDDGRVVPYGYTPLERTSIAPQYIGRAAVYLASDYFSRYTTGTVLKIDAGLSLFNYQCAFDAGLYP